MICSLFYFLISAQSPISIDTIKYFKINGVTQFTIQGKDTILTLNGKPFPIKKYLEFQKHNCRLEGDCKDSTENIFFVKTYNTNGRLLYSTYKIDPEENYWGTYTEYYENGKIKIQGQYMFFGNDWKKYYDEKNLNVKIGTWLYYNKKGKIIRQTTY